jgi:ABC-type Fe3+ transport system substrate-binding protein
MNVPLHRTSRAFRLFWQCALLLGVGASSAAAIDVPDATRQALKELKLDESVLTGLDRELQVPEAWIEGARKEGTFRIGGSWDPAQFRAMTASFVARYPFIKPNYSRGNFNARAFKPLLAFQDGRYITDVVTGIGGAMHQFIDSNALQDLSDLPGLRNVLDGMKHKDNLWTGIRVRYWCMSYNTGTVKKEELPRTWDDILSHPRWRDGKLAIGNLPQLWLLPLSAAHGDDWTKQYLAKLFGEVKPQLRKEGANQMLTLVSAGEMDAAIPSGDHRIVQYQEKGAPLGWHCPEPVPSAISEGGILRGAPNMNAAKLFMNWLLSKEGQIAQYAADDSPPIHKDLQIQAFLPFPEQILGKKIAFRDPGLEEEHGALLELWNPYWERRK